MHRELNPVPRGSKPLSPHVASWLGTFVAAGFQLAFSARDEKSRLLGGKTLRAGIRMALLGPTIGFALWKVFNQNEAKGSVLPIAAASLIGSGLLKREDEVESVNTVIWLRIASSVWSSFGRNGVDALTHVAIVITFYGVVNHTAIAPTALVKMTRRFLTPTIFESVKTGNENSSNGASSLKVKDILAVFKRTFKGLFVYNYFLHFSAALVGYAVRLLGSKAVKGTRNLSNDISRVLVQAAKEATILNMAVSASCSLLVAGSKLGGSSTLGVIFVPLPLYLCAPRVRDTVYFLFLPWLLMGIYLLEGPLRALSNDHEGYAWMISVAFGLVKTAGSGLI